MWHKAEWMGRPMRLKLTCVGLLVQLANRYTTRGALCRYLSISFHGTTLTKWHFDTKKSSLCAAYIIIIISCRQHGYPWPSLATSSYHSSSCFCLAICGVHRSTSLMSSSLLLQQCPACLVRLTCRVFVMRGKWSYIWCLVGCCRQDLFNIALNILV